jgi:sugar/nucleoside kinase (ribokinase family)
METLKDPTGAGDSFAGGFMGYLSRTNELSDKAMKQAVIYGTIMASFCVQDFGPGRLLRLRPSDIEKRMREYKRCVCA